MWKDLSNDAKNVIEWLENPFTGKLNRLMIVVGETFIATQTNILITQNLFDEIVEYVKSDENISYEIEDKTLFFEFTNGYKTKNNNEL